MITFDKREGRSIMIIDIKIMQLRKTTKKRSGRKNMRSKIKSIRQDSIIMGNICNSMKMILFTALITLGLMVTASAESNWNFTLGAGVYGEGVYKGSDDYYVTPLPAFKATYLSGQFLYSFSILEGISATYMNQKYGLMSTINVNFGYKRDSEEFSVVGVPVKHSDKTSRFLEGTPNLETPATISFSLDYLTQAGMIGINIAYHPTKMEYDRNGYEDNTRHGVVYSIRYMNQYQISKRLSVAGLAGLEFMNKDYARAWYSVDYETESLSLFKADAGLQDFQAAVQFNYLLTKQIGITIDWLNTFLLADAKDSPYTLESHQQTAGLQLFYNF
ncbi:MAG: hypothetical protein GF310_07500 [candidate division Zixibacteria bacterium]|nr:hypothetical protein [candidate division Zixibacteria bacterium]